MSKYFIQGESVEAIADEVRELSGTTELMGLTAIASNVGEANSEINIQAELLAQIISALDGKAAGGSGGGGGTYTHCLYNGVRLPKIPEDVAAQYPYAVIRKNTTTEYYDLILSDSGFYVTNGGALNDFRQNNNPLYRFPIGETTDVNWTKANNTQSSTWGVDDARPLLWSSHDITTRYDGGTGAFITGSEPIPIA